MILLTPVTDEVQTFVFADLAGFTALTEAHGDEEAITIVEQFTSSVRDLLPEHGAEAIKTIGDEVMIRCPDSHEAVKLGLRIVDELVEHGSPPIRVGMHAGPALERQGDWFGATVNLASRVSGVAGAGEVWLTEATQQRLPLESGIDLRPRGARFFKHIPERVTVYSAAKRGGSGREFEIDPVCRMAVDHALADEQVHRGGNDYYFCSEACAESFRKNPGRYIGRSCAARAARAGFLIHRRVFIAAQLAFLLAWAIGWALGESAMPWFLVILIPWGIGLAFHYRGVRGLL